MGYKIAEIEGIGDVYAEKLAGVKVTNTDQLLAMCCDKKGRSKVAEESGISEKLLLSWANKADLMRLKGIGSEYSDLLEAAGVDTVKELRTRNAANLTAKLAEVNEAKKLTRAVPAESVVTGWINEAKETEPKITH